MDSGRISTVGWSQCCRNVLGHGKVRIVSLGLPSMCLLTSFLLFKGLLRRTPNQSGNRSTTPALRWSISFKNALLLTRTDTRQARHVTHEDTYVEQDRQVWVDPLISRTMWTGPGMGGPGWTLSGRGPAVWTASGSSEACYPPAVRAGVSQHGLVSRFRERAGPSPRSWTVDRLNEVVQPRGSRQLAISGGIG
ncbi:MAG: hypothetical protein QOI21_2660 [Actinomycetota bacterium]|nr:hypothetical protein [Actinomycetota bacterium]